MNDETKVWTAEEVLKLPVKVDVPTAGAIIGNLCKDESYRMVKRGEFPVPVIKVGRKLFVPVAPILQLLGLDTRAAGAPTPAAADEQTARPDERSEAHGKPARLRALSG